MSSSLIPLETVKTEYVETSLLEADGYAYNVFKGSSESTYRRVTTTSYSLSSISFSAPPPSPQIIVSKKIYFQLKVRITINGTIAVGNLLDGYGLTIAPRSLPLSNSIQNMVLQINDGSFNLALSDIISPITRYGYDKQKRHISGSPTYLDQSQNYDELINTIKNPLGARFNSNNTNDDQRGGFNQVQIISNTPTSAVFELTFIEPLIISPLSVFDNEPGLINVKSLDINFNMESNLIQKMISKAPIDAGVWNNTSIEIIEQPALLFTYYSPQLDKPISNSYIYPFIRLERYVTDYNDSVAPGQVIEITSNSLQLSTIPKRMYIFARRANSTLTVNSTDTFMRIENVSLSFGNRSGLLSSATPFQLYTMSANNGCDLSFQDWYGSYGTNSNRAVSGVGSVLSIDSSISLGLDPISAAGTQSQLNIQMTVKLQNINPTDTYTKVALYVIVLSEGVFTMVNNHVQSQIGLLSGSEVLSAPLVSVVDSSGASGGNFFTKLSNIIKKVAPYVSKALPYVKTAYDVARFAGLGTEEEMMNEKLQEKADEMDYAGEGRKRRGRKKGSSVVGGELISRSQLKDSLY